jgi:tellurite resistance protein TehA-like permease
MLALIILTFYLLWTVETIRTKTLGKSLILPTITSIIAGIVYLISPDASIVYLIIISVASGFFIYKKANSMEDVEIYYKYKR